MAEEIEETDRDKDVDLQVDRNDFFKSQFDVFKHNFLESFDEAGYEKLEHLTLNHKLKKEVVNMLRRLQRAKISLATLKGDDLYLIQPVIQKIEEVFKQLIEFSKQSSEFSTRNIKLPDYCRKDMESLLGESSNTGNNAGVEKCDLEQEEYDPLKWLCKSNEEYEKKITELLGAAELLMNEWHEIKNYVKDM